MKNFLLTILLVSVCCLTGSAQTLNQSAAWPNSNWTLSGTFDAGALIADPTGADANWSYDDDAAGSGSTDELQLASPVIDLTPASTAGETLLTITFNYNYNLGAIFDLEYYDADAASWLLLEAIPDNSSTTSNWCGSLMSFTSQEFDISGFTTTQLSGFQYRFNYNASSVFGWGFCTDAPTITSAAPPACPDPSALSAGAITSNSADLSWTENGSATAWDIELVDITAGGTAMGTVTYNDVTNPYTATSLAANNDYEFYVRADCGSDNTDVSAWVGPIAFKTLCNAAAAPFSESFDAGVTPDCWSQSADSGGPWAFSTGSGVNTACGTPADHTGNGGFFAWMDQSGTDVTVVLQMVDVDVSSLTTPFLRFYHKMCTSNPNNTFVEAWTGSAWAEVANVTPASNDWEEFGFDLTGFTFGSNIVRIRFRAESGGSGNDFESDNLLDDIEIIELPACPNPSSGSASNITTNSADLAWTENGTAAVWDVEIVDVTAGGTQTMMPTANDVSNPYTAMSLSSGNEYEFYVRADCGADNTDVSDWAGPFAFTTVPDYCSGDLFYDTGGPTGNYSSSANVTTTICPDNTGDVVSVTFNSFATENNYDGLSIYDGSDASAPLIDSGKGAGFNSTTAPAGSYYGTAVADSPGTVIATGASGCLTFVFTSDGSGTDTGWDATVSCITPSACEITAISGTPGACNPADNTYTADVTVTYTDAPAGGMLDVNGQQFAITSSPQVVTLTGLDSDGADVDVTATFTDDVTCTFTATAVYTAPTLCQPGFVCDNPIVAAGLPYSVTDNTGNYGDDVSGSPGSAGCGTTSSYLNGDDVFYSYTPSADMNVNITMDPTGTWSGVFVYASCADVGTNCLAGVANSGSTIREINNLALTGGQTYYIVISTFPSPQTTGYTLTIEEACTITAITAGTQSSCDPLTNEYSQDIEVSFVAAPTTGTLDVTIDGITESVAVDGTTTSPVTVTVPGLTADNASKDVTAAFSADAACTLTETDVFTSAMPCTVVCDITNIEDAGTGVMNCVGTTFDYEVTVTFINPPASGTLDVTAGTGSGSIAVNALTTSPQTVLITGITADGNAVDVTAAFSLDGACTETVTGLFTALSVCPPVNDDCVNAVSLVCNDPAISGTTNGATETPSPGTCFMSNFGVWYTFTGTGDEATVTTTAAFDHEMAILSTDSDCNGTFTTIVCDDSSTGTETHTFTTVDGTVYYVYVSHFSSSSTITGDITIQLTCVAPNDDCADAVNLNGNGGTAGVETDTPVQSSTANATPSTVPANSCSAGDPDDDVWFTFVSDSNGGTTTVTIVPDGTFSPVVEFYTGSCGTLTYVLCETGTSIDFTTGANQQIWLRVYDAGTGFTGGGDAARAAGGFTISVAGSALPAELTSFTGAAMDKYNTLKWATATEQNTAEFAVERSLDGRNDWAVIGTTPAAGNSDTEITYGFDDMRPATQGYYRLRTIDLDGTSQVSNIISIKRDAGAFDVTLIAPNPTFAETIVTFESLEATKVQAIVTDITGKTVSVATQDAERGVNNMTIDLTNAPSGVYFLTMHNGETNITRRIVKN